MEVRFFLSRLPDLLRDIDKYENLSQLNKLHIFRKQRYTNIGGTEHSRVCIFSNDLS